HIAETSLHKVGGCQSTRQQVRMMALPTRSSNQKWRICLSENLITRRKVATMSIFAALLVAFAPLGFAQDERNEDKDHEREELGVNPYTAPSIEHIVAQLDQLRPLPFEQLQRGLPQTII